MSKICVIAVAAEEETGFFDSLYYDDWHIFGGIATTKRLKSICHGYNEIGIHNHS